MNHLIERTWELDHETNDNTSWINAVTDSSSKLIEQIIGSIRLKTLRKWVN